MFVLSICKGKHSAMLKNTEYLSDFEMVFCECALKWLWLSVCLTLNAASKMGPCCRTILLFSFYSFPFVSWNTLCATLTRCFAHPWHTLRVHFDRMVDILKSSMCLSQHLRCKTQGCSVSSMLQLYRSIKLLQITHFRPLSREGCVQLIFTLAFS